MTTHTPGPWKPDHETVYLIGGDGEHIADFEFSPHHNAANLNLAAAAPDLLEACKAALRRYESLFGKTTGGATHAERLLIEAAIAKATGLGGSHG